MSKSVYITIDDTPSANSDMMIDFLADHDIQATIFCRGDGLERFPDAAIRAVQKGQILANHNYSHTPAGELSYEQAVAEIMHTESLLDDTYERAGVNRNGKYFRFPYIDRGDGDRLERRFTDIANAVERGENLALGGNNKTERIQKYLRDNGFTQPYCNVTHPLYQHAIAKDYIDSLFTFSSCDWMMTERHKGQWQYKTIEDLKFKIDEDAYLQKEGSVSVALFHDQAEIIDVSIHLIEHMVDTGFTFLRL
jgi:peptidoglycan/xylan/chitin deacetylase (PgdA/CDA1 family)